jgi:dipeptidyl aminopeptidase/acylaminoacyl peptidase
MKRTTLVLTVFAAAMVMALMMVAMAVPVFAGGQDDEEDNDNENASGGARRNGQIVFRRYFDPDQTKGAIFTMNPDGSHIRQITHPPKGWRDNVPAWSPDGKRITFERFKSDESTSRVMVVNPDTGRTRTVVPCTGERCEYAFDPYFSPDGDSIAYWRAVDGPPYSAIFIVGLDGSDPHQVTTTPKHYKGPLPTFDTSDPVISPNGKMLSFIRTNFQKENDRSAVFVQPLGSPEDAQRITPWKLNSQDRPTFSPDGKLILFRSEPEGEEGPSNLYFLHPDGTGLHQLTHENADKRYLGSSFSPSFHKGEGWITVGRTGGYGKDGNADVFRILIEDGKVVRSVNLTKSEKWESAPGWGTHPPVG